MVAFSLTATLAANSSPVCLWLVTYPDALVLHILVSQYPRKIITDNTNTAEVMNPANVIIRRLFDLLFGQARTFHNQLT